MSEATTYGASVAALQTMDQKAQGCDQAAQTCAQGVQGMTASQQALDAALHRFELDRRTLTASARLQDSSDALERTANEVAAESRRLGESTQAALESVGQHRQLAQAVQEHGEAAQMGWYRGGR
jgi:hypothetical protein